MTYPLPWAAGQGAPMTLSPSFTRLTFEPSFSTVPVPSSPGTQGNLAGLKPSYKP